jgi:hypothetical protein
MPAPARRGVFYAAMEFEMPAGGAVPSVTHEVRGAIRVQQTAEDGYGPQGGALGLVRVMVDPVTMRHRQEAGALLGGLGLPILVMVARARRRV